LTYFISRPFILNQHWRSPQGQDETLLPRMVFPAPSYLPTPE